MVFFFLSGLSLFAKPVIQWNRTMGSPFGCNLHSSQQTGDGGYFPGGFSQFGSGFDKTNPGVGDFDDWIVKLSAVGIKQRDNA